MNKLTLSFSICLLASCVQAQTGSLGINTDGSTPHATSNGQVLTANGSGNAAWLTVGGSMGFSAQASATTLFINTQITNWTTTNPGFTGTGFNAATGTFTVPETGTYAISVTINYSLTGAVNTMLGAGINPLFNVTRTFPPSTVLLTGVIPILNVNLPLAVTMRAPLETATITMTKNVALTAGDVVGLFYDADGFSSPIVLNNTTSATSWSMKKL